MNLMMELFSSHITNTSQISDYQNLKYITLVRHAESVYNKTRTAALKSLNLRQLCCYDYELYDAHLTMTGFEQAKRLGQILHDSQFDLVITSPLSRALQTTLEEQDSLSPSSREVLQKVKKCTRSHVPHILVTPLATEWLDTTSDCGKPLDQLQKSFKVYDDVLDWKTWINNPDWEKKFWWYHAEKGPCWPYNLYRLIAPEPKDLVKKRVTQFKDFLTRRNEKTICVIGHSWLFQLLTNERKFKNCEMRHYIYDTQSREFRRISHPVTIEDA